MFPRWGKSMRNSIIALLLWCSAVSGATAVTADDLAADAPDRYIVVPGDTLWGIAGRFLKSPWRWSELWKNNQAQIKNPNLIYPGDVLILDRSALEVRLKLLKTQAAIETVKLSPQIIVTPHEPEPVPAVPVASIAPFLSQPLVVTQNELDGAAHIVATQEDRVALGMGNTAYVQGIDQKDGDKWRIFHRGDALIDPDTKEKLGYQAIYLGDARVVKFGDVSTVEIVKSTQEITTGDALLPASRDVLQDFQPHAPAAAVTGRIINIYSNLFETGPLSIVALNKGASDGLDSGSVLAIYRDLNSPAYRLGSVQSKADHPDLPNERYGLLMVFRVFDHVSYALVMSASRPVSVFDSVANP